MTTATAPRVVRELRATVTGRVIEPGDVDYDRARTVCYGIDRRPAAVVRARDAGDVARTVRLAREHDLELAVRSGGHSPAGHGTTDGGIVLDLAGLKGVEIDVRRRTAWAGAGLTAGEYTAATAVHGLATGFGDTGSVGVGGITLSGGVGYLVRKHGLTIDNLLAADVVTADGELRRADPRTHPDLFWAIRGGGGNVGVATRFHYRLHEVDTVIGGTLVLPATPRTLTRYLAEGQAAPEQLTSVVTVMPAGNGPFVLRATLVYAGGSGTANVPSRRSAGSPSRSAIRSVPPATRTFSCRRAASTRPGRTGRCSSTTSTSTRPEPFSPVSGRATRRCRSRSCACWAGRWRASPRTPRPSRTARRRYWRASPRLTGTPARARPGSTGRRGACARVAARPPGSSATRDGPVCGRRIRAGPGIGWPG